MADIKERRNSPRNATAPTPRPDSTKPGTKAPASPAPATSGARADISNNDVRRQIAEAAYLRAKERGFEPGHEVQDWVEAESEVMGRINGADR
jgi:hypothetical protein